MARIGWVECGVCGNPEAALSKNEHGTVTLRCHRCEFSGFAKAGTKSARDLQARMKPDADAAPEPKPAKPAKAAPTPEPTPQPRRVPNSAFALGEL